jgi:hypothetical protein
MINRRRFDCNVKSISTKVRDADASPPNMENSYPTSASF